MMLKFSKGFLAGTVVLALGSASPPRLIKWPRPAPIGKLIQSLSSNGARGMRQEGMAVGKRPITFG